jgi:hypothetical protein
MIDKTIKLDGEYPSDFKPSISVQEIQQHFEAYNLHSGRMLGGSKTGYSIQRPNNLIIFNANVLMSDVGKVWHGDLNLTEDYLVLKDIAKSLNSTLYVLWESEGRFGEENKPLTALLDKAVWSTDDTKPTKEWYKKKMKKVRRK